MQYRADKKSENMLSMLGFGCMRFPQIGGEAERMVIAAIENGVNYFDTAYIYPNSEKTLGAILKKHDKRKDVFVATKMPISMTRKYEDFDKFFNTQLQRLQTDYIDYYLMHSISSYAQWDSVLKIDVEKWIAEKKASGQIKQAGFSFHGSGDDFPKILNSYDWDFCMIQYNYYDENYQAGKRGLIAAAEKGISVMVMEPLLGGRLATGLPKKAVEAFADADPEKTPADWGLQWVWNHEEVTVVLSGMTNTKITEANMRAASDFIPLKKEELEVYNQVREIFQKSYKVKCTGCGYCLPCPQGIDIPARFTAFNTSYAQNYFTGIVMYITGMGAMSQNPISVRSCTACGKCEKACPQSIPIRDELKKVGKRLEPLPVRALLRIAKRVLR